MIVWDPPFYQLNSITAMGNDNTITGTFNGTVHLEYLPCINYAMIHNHVPSCNFCELMNSDEVDWNNIKVSIDGELIKYSESILEIIPPGQNIQINNLEISPESEKLIELTEGIDTNFHLTITISGEIAHQQTFPIKLMAYDQWSGSRIMPELLATFVTPNHPILSRISVKASQFLEKWTGNSALDEYQTQDPNRVRAQVAAIYEALRSESLIYSTVPASFETSGQRVRLVDNVLTSKLGTCIDLTLLYASCLEANGIHPLLVLLKGHILVGAWLTEDIYHQTVGDDASFLLKGSANGISDIVLVETTALASSQNISFEEAATMAQREIKEENRFELFIDVYRCRLDKIRPLPQRINHNGEWQIENSGIEHENVTQRIHQLDRYEIKLEDGKDEITKQIIWERKLLDFSLRNNLINIRLGRRVIPFISFEIDHLEDHLQAGENYQILPSPAKSKIEPGETGLYDSSLWKENLEELVISELRNKKLHSYLTESELQNSLKFVYRTSRTAIEENGANSLFLVLGILKWYESPKSVKPRFAPILLLPVDIVRRGGSSGYIIRTRDEEIILNITLVELLKQQFSVNLSGLNPLPKDDSGVDVKKIFATIRTCIRNMKGWDVVEESMLGLFSFNKFVMWNDIHTNADKLKKNAIIASLMENRIQWQDTTPEIDAREIDKNLEPIHFAIPVDVDSSQLEAVIESGEGKSFILHGPPGTGKSQTITNMIANALYKGKRVLFVAEKIPSLTMEAASSSEIGILKRNISNGGRGTSIRRIIDQIPTLLPKLCPCMLMSPISVAQYIDLDAEKFDLVIFDEASQMPTSEAVGAIARGNALVVVGDPKQMPPTSFFSSSQVDEEEAEFDDMESILDDCISLSIPSRYLTWHYRSKHESLIAFSNSQYYNGKLYTFPSVDDRISKVRLVQVDGTYDKGRTRSNHAEAEAIVKEILNRLRTSEVPEKSIGVVSFSQVQQNLIEDMLIEELNKYPELEERAFQSNEPIFIKNLENVQGDERDIILFSIGYGPDRNGNVSMNFGPLNNQGGERRLNVAVSRARYEMIIFSTLRSEQIDLKRTKSKGVEGLKRFLEFAERGTSPIPAIQLQNLQQSNLITLIAQELTQRGYKVDTLVGRSNFKVDLAIVNPLQPDTYILGILCDGRNYYETKTTRDREIVQPNVLQMLHWNVMRVWSVDWFEHKENVMERIIKKLEYLKNTKAEEQPPLPTENNVLKTFSIENEPVVELVNNREREYIFADLPDIGYSTDIDTVMASSYQVKKQLQQIVRIEQPITNTLLYKRILRIWNLTRVTTRLQVFIDSLLEDAYKDPLSGDTIIYWENKEKAKDCDFYRINSKRDILDIPILEVMSAARYAIEQQISMPIEDLKRLTSQLLGFSRKGNNLDMVTEQTIQLLINKGIFSHANGMVSMNN